jgi:drug/metabolite transporter (DMT)-like permease
MIVLCVILGLHQVAIKIAAPDIAPILQISLRSGLSAILVFLMLAIRRQSLAPLLDGTILPGIGLGIAFSVEFLCVAEGLRYTSASHMSVFLYTAPIFIALALHRFVPSERLSQHQWMGIILAFAGIVLAFTGGSLHFAGNPRELWGDTLAVLGGMAWAITTVIIRCTSLSAAPATKTLLYQLVSAFVLLSIYAVLSGQTAVIRLTTLSVSSVLFQGIIITFAVYLVWFSLLRCYHVPQISAFLFLTPVFGITFGVLLLHEKVTVHFIIGSILVLMGVTLVSIRNISLKFKSTVKQER